jgi:hypothetical protein
VNTTTTSEGSAFAQSGGKDNNKDTSNQNLSERNQEYWKTKTCYNCNKKGHPSSHCPESKKDGNASSSKKKDSDDKSRASRSSKADDISKMPKKLKKSFATMETKIHELEKEDLTDSDDGEEESHFQYQ